MTRSPRAISTYLSESGATQQTALSRRSPGHPPGARNIERVARSSAPRAVHDRSAAGREDRSTRPAVRSRRLLRAGRPLSPAVDTPDDRDPRQGRRRSRHHVACPDPAPVVLCAALEAGATRVLRIGGAQAIAALAYGTASIPRVSQDRRPGKCVGRGGQGTGVCATARSICTPARAKSSCGPTQGASTGSPRTFSRQAEHDPAARAILVTRSRRLARAVAAEIDRWLPPTGPARTAVRRNGAVIVTRTRQEIRRRRQSHRAGASRVRERERRRADSDRRHDLRRTDGARRRPATTRPDSNHVLPTGGAARFRGGLSPADFVRTFTEQTVTRRRPSLHRAPRRLRSQTPKVSRQHARSIRIRL